MERTLWPIAAAPLVVSLLAFGVAAALFLSLLDPLTAELQSWLHVSAPESWLGWVWVGPLRSLSWLVRWTLVATFAALVYLSFTLVGGILASPFLEALSRRVERLRTGGVVEEHSGSVAAALRSAARIAIEEAKRVALFVALQATLLLLGLVPGLQLVTIPAALLLGALFLPLDYAGYILDRRALRLRLRIRWALRNASAVGSFGAAAFLTYALPLVNFLALPWLVVAATLLVLDLGPPEESGSADPTTPV